MLYTINTPRGAKTNQTVEIDFSDAKSLRLFLFFFLSLLTTIFVSFSLLTLIIDQK